MQNVTRLLFLTVAVVIVGGVAALMIARRQTARNATSQAGKVAEADLVQSTSEVRSTAAPAATLATPTTSDFVPREAGAPPEYSRPSKSAESPGPTNSASRKAVAQAPQGGPPAKEPWRDPMAREALAFVGADEVAEAYWYGAINDPTLPPNERQDLIEDLNEDGLSDPKHPAADDLPLIFRRLLIIEEVALDAMDEVNADAFQEAYKDLVNLANLAMGGGEPVR